MAYIENVRTGTNDLAIDAWGKSKTTLDYSLYSTVFTRDIPYEWREFTNDVEQSSFGNMSIVNGKLVLTSTVNNQRDKASTIKHNRYRPNRGHLLSTACFIPTANGSGSHKIGMFNAESGVWIELDNGQWYACTRTKVDGVVTDNKNPFTMPASFNGVSFDATKGNLYDIRFQWRGVGNYEFFVNQTLVYTINNLGTLDELSIFNPALPVSFECVATSTDNATIEAGCVDVTTEGGNDINKKYGSLAINNADNSTEVEVSNPNIPIIALRSKSLISGTSGNILNTRDTSILMVKGYGNQKGVVRVWKTRENASTAIELNDQDWTDYGDGHLEYIIRQEGVTAMAFDTGQAELITQARFNIDETIKIDDFSDIRTSLDLYPGELIVVTINRENLTGVIDCGAVLSFAEKV